MNLLLALRIYGPISRVALADKLNRLPDDVGDEFYDTLKPAGLAAYDPRFSTWSITEKGCREVDHHEVAVSVRRDEARACVGRAN